MIEQSHLGYKGLQGTTLRMARNFVFWPGTKDIIAWVQQCKVCQKTQNDNAQEPI